MTSDSLAARLYAASSMLAWCAALNALWLMFTLLGGVVLGIGPATVAACILTRRRMRGESIHLRDFASIWRQEFFRGSAVVLPVAAVTVLLWWNYAFFSALAPAAGPARLATLAAFAVAVGAGAYVAPMYAHYHLPLPVYPLKALRMALARPASTVLLLLVFTALAFATAAVPLLLLTLSVGVWLQTSTWLCVRFFEENEHRLANRGKARTAGPDLLAALPSEPLRIR